MRYRPTIAVLAFILGATAVYAQQAAFRGRVVAEWLNDGRAMKLVEPFEFVDQKRKRWRVPAGAVVDGASIPKVFWSIIGGPFEGKYRNASVIHDHYCDKRTRAANEVHEAFYQAMLAGGVEPKTAYLMHQAVLRFGPQWEAPAISGCQKAGVLDFEECIENSDAPKPAMVLRDPKRSEVFEFADQFKGSLSAGDLERLLAAARQVPD